MEDSTICQVEMKMSYNSNISVFLPYKSVLLTSVMLLSEVRMEEVNWCISAVIRLSNDSSSK
jgi:hypothetical protein